ncbi:MAG: toxin ParE1/3/4 [Cellvibrionaceae bacterium]|jgi:toxin ParE1/3/4
MTTGESNKRTITPTAIGHAIEAMLDNPKIGINIDYIRQGYRMYHHQHNLIIYRLTATTIKIVRVLGEKMDVKRHL